MVVFKIIALDLLVIRHCLVNCITRKSRIKGPGIDTVKFLEASVSSVAQW